MVFHFDLEMRFLSFETSEFRRIKPTYGPIGVQQALIIELSRYLHRFYWDVIFISTFITIDGIKHGCFLNVAVNMASILRAKLNK